MSMQMPMPMPPDAMMYNNSNSMGMVMMQMSFFWGKDVVVLFEGWPGHRLGMYFLALIFVMFLALAVEVLSISLPSNPGSNPMVSSLAHAGVYALRMVLAYMVMLSVMSFNLGVFIVAVAGHGLGRFLVKYRSFAAATRAATAPSPKV